MKDDVGSLANRIGRTSARGLTEHPSNFLGHLINVVGKL